MEFEKLIGFKKTNQQGYFHQNEEILYEFLWAHSSYYHAQLIYVHGSYLDGHYSK